MKINKTMLIKRCFSYKKWIIVSAAMLFFLQSNLFAEDIESKYFGKDLGDTNVMNHFMINIFVGGLTGGGFGYLGSYATYQNNSKNGNGTNQGIFTGVGFLLGAAAGTFGTIVEINKKEQFTYSKGMWQYSWYGVILGGGLGTAVGVIPYSSTKDKKGAEDLLNFMGYGVCIGVPVSLALFFILYNDKPDKLSDSYQRKSTNALDYAFDFYPKENGEGYFQFKLSRKL